MINTARDECIQLIKDEMKRCDDNKIKSVDEAKKNLQKNLDDKIQNIIKEEQTSWINLSQELNKIAMKEVNDFILISENSNININTKDKKIMPGKLGKGITSALSLLTGAKLSVAVDSSLLALYGGHVTAGTTAYGVISIASSLSLAGIAIGIPLLIYKGYNYFHKTERYKDALQTLKKSISDYFYDYLLRFEENFKLLEEDINKNNEIMLEIKNINLENIDKNKWKKIQEEYLELRADIIKVIEYNNSKI